MKVRELIDTLKGYDPEMMVVVRGYEGGYDEVGRTCVLNICLNVHDEWYYGKHDMVFDINKAEGYEQRNVVQLIKTGE